jgi:tRNA(Arg) A34 adenosine deaminase TadA
MSLLPHDFFMREALKEADSAAEAGEVPIGAVACLMCVGAAVHARIRTLVYGTTEPRAGAIESNKQRVYEHPSLNHRITIAAGVLANECRARMLAFFQERRA